MSLGDAIKEHWATGSALIAVAFQATLAFQKNLSDISLATRFLIAGAAGVWATVAVAEILRRKKPKSSKGFAPTIEVSTKSPAWYAARVLAIVVVCALSIFLLIQVETFHSVRVLERRGMDPFVGIVEFQPAHRPATLTVSLSTSQVLQVKIVDIAPASWNDNDRVRWGVRNQSDHGMTLLLENFQSPQVFGVWYRLSAKDTKIDVDVNSDPPEVQVIRDGKLAEYRSNIWIFGGILCIGALLYWAYRSSWFGPVP